jgi:prevent-host-death family protein
MQVAVSALRADLKEWLDRARSGDEVVITDRGVPVARLIGVDSTTMIEGLIRDGVISPPRRSKQFRARTARRVHAARPVSELVAEQRAERDDDLLLR